MTPVRNEAWILPRFLACASLWADHIVIADQGSDDGSREIARRHPRVTLIDNPSSSYSESERQQLLIGAARRFPPPRLLIALDADEILSANAFTGLDWQKALLAPPGTVLALAKVELAESIDSYFAHTGEDLDRLLPFGYVDDGRAHASSLIHACRVPLGPQSKWLALRDAVVLHYDHLNPPRRMAKSRWYRCFERTAFPEKSVVEITRLYAGIGRPGFEVERRPARRKWFAAYRAAGIDLTSIAAQPEFWWDWDILRMFAAHGTGPFRHLDVWSVDWERLRLQGVACGLEGLPAHPIRPPLGRADRWTRTLLRHSHRFRPRRCTDPLLAAWSAALSRRLS